MNMLGVINRKNKINISDYSYKKDIANRLFIADLSPFDIQVLQELLFYPSKVKLNDLADSVGCELVDLDHTLTLFSQIGLTMKQGETLFVDKEMRKYFEFQIEKFSDSFEPSFEYIQGLLSKVPISVLPSWYSIPRTSDNIFQSILEKYLLTPKIYENYLTEVTFSEPIITHIIRDVFSSPELKVLASHIRDRYSLSKEKFQEYMLLLEFHFVLVSTFDDCQEIITPFHEWREYQLFLRKKKPPSIDDKLVTLLRPTEQVSSLKKQEEAMKLFKATIDSWQEKWSDILGSVERSVYEIEKAMRTLPEGAWIALDDFIASMICPIGKQEAVSLQRQGKKWRYALPRYSPDEKSFIKLVIFDLLHSVGITAVGTHNNQSYFKITPFGRVALGEQ